MFRRKAARRKKGFSFGISPAFLALLLLFAVVDHQGLLLPILLAAAIHEAGHVLALYVVGGRLCQFRITIFGGELQILHSERLSYGRELLAVLAGPAANFLCALLLARAAVCCGWEQGYLSAGIHLLLGGFNMLPLRALDGGRSLFLVLSWLFEPITADRIVHGVSVLVLGGLLLCGAALQSMIGLQLPLLLLEGWFVLSWCTETGIVKPAATG